MIRTIVVSSVFLMCLSALPSFAQEAASFEEANRLFQNEEYGEAIALYRILIDDSKYNPELYYNLGNAYYRDGKIGLAILNYEKAKLLDPRNDEINQNLAFVSGQIEYRIEDKRNWYLKTASEILSDFSFMELLILCLFFYFLIMAVMLLRFLIKRPFMLRRTIWAFVFLFVFSFISCAFKYMEVFRSESAVVVVPEAVFRYGPSSNDKIAFRLVEGLRGRIQDEREGWYLVKLTNGENGWTQKENLGIVKI